MWFFTENLFEYLRQRPFGQKVADMILMISVFTWIAGVYIVATNYPAIRQALFTQNIDMKSLVQLDKSINEILTHTMTQGSFDRGALARLHNTVTDLQGRHFIYESRSNEVVLPGVAPIAALRQNVLISMINTWAQAFIKNECFYMTNLQTTDIFYEFYRQTGTKADIKCPVYSTGGIWIGYIIFEYTTKAANVSELKVHEAMIREAASKIGAILSLRTD